MIAERPTEVTAKIAPKMERLLFESCTKGVAGKCASEHCAATTKVTKPSVQEVGEGLSKSILQFLSQDVFVHVLAILKGDELVRLSVVCRELRALIGQTPALFREAAKQDFPKLFACNSLWQSDERLLYMAQDELRLVQQQVLGSQRRYINWLDVVKLQVAQMAGLKRRRDALVRQRLVIPHASANTKKLEARLCKVTQELESLDSRLAAFNPELAKLESYMAEKQVQKKSIQSELQQLGQLHQLLQQAMQSTASTPLHTSSSSPTASSDFTSVTPSSDPMAAPHQTCGPGVASSSFWPDVSTCSSSSPGVEMAGTHEATAFSPNSGTGWSRSLESACSSSSEASTSSSPFP